MNVTCRASEVFLVQFEITFLVTATLLQLQVWKTDPHLNISIIVKDVLNKWSLFSGTTNNSPAPTSTNRNIGPGPGQSSYNDFNNRVSQSHNNISGMTSAPSQNRSGSVTNAVDEQLDRNLDDMASSLARLKGLAQGLNTELDEHNDILGRVADKTDVVGFKVDKQNKDMGKILKK